MNSWKEIMGAADKAKLTLVSDRSTGERAFSTLLTKYPNDGMIYFKRGEAYEALGERKLAEADYQRAMALFPMPAWKERAKEAMNRVA